MKRLARWFAAGRRSDDQAAAGRNPPPALPINLTDPHYLANPHPVEDWLRTHAPVAPLAGGGYLVTRHADVIAAFTDDRLGNAPSRFAVLHQRQAGKHLTAAMAQRMPPFLDMPEHRLPRQALSRAFHASLDGFAPVAADLAQEVVGRLPRGERFDLIARAATPFACRSIAAFVGLNLPPETLKPATAAFFQLFAPITDADRFAEGTARLAAMRLLLAQALDLRRADPGRDLISHLLAFQGDHPDLTDDQIIDGAYLFLANGVENIEAGAALALRTLLAIPWACEALRRGGPQAQSIVAEALRLNTPALTVPRIARQSLTLHGTEIAADLPVYLHLGSAARDPLVFEDADMFRLDRVGAQVPVFGLGRHRCIGERLGLLQVGALLTALLWAGVQDLGAPFAFHNRPGHRWPKEMPVSLNRTAA